jgi:DNA-binding transcriptional LysR family regulator
MELRHLRYFVAVAEELHFTRAAQRLHLGQPPLSQQIQALEAELGVMLLRRSRRKVELTDAGVCFLRRARQILAASSAAVDEAQRAARGELGMLRVGFTASLSMTHFFPRLIYDYRQHYPQVALTLSELTSAEQCKVLLARELDIGFIRCVDPEAPPGINVRVIHRHPLRVAINVHHPLAARAQLSLAELSEEGFIGYPDDAGTGLTVLLQRLCLLAGFQAKVIQEAREATTQIGLVAAGLGVAVLPSPLECVHIEGVRYLPLTDPGAYLSLAVASAQTELSPLINGFLERLEVASGLTPPDFQFEP